MTKKTILIADIFIILCLLFGVLLVFISFNDPTSFTHIFQNHVRHYAVGASLGILTAAFFWKKMSWDQLVVYFFIPAVIASGWPDIIYFFSYLIENGTYKGVLTFKNTVYSVMHTPLGALSAAPVLTMLLKFFNDKQKRPMASHYVYIILALTAVASLLHVFLDLRFGF